MSVLRPVQVGRREFVRWLTYGGVGMAMTGGMVSALPDTAGAQSAPAGAHASKALEADAEVLAVVGATLIDGIGNQPRNDTAVVLAGDRIVWVGNRRDVVVPEGAQVVEARGRFVIPGLWDLHTHLTSSREEVYPPLYIANGVTGIREMWGDAALHALRDRIEGGRLLGPRIVIASDIIDGPSSVWPDATQVANADEGRAAVRAAKAEGADFVKVYSFLDRDTLAAIVEEGRVLGLPVAGHLPWRVPAVQASDFGMRGMEHLFGLPTAVSGREAEIQRTLADTPIDPARPRKFYDLARELDRQASSAYDPIKAQALYARLARNGTWQSPTLTVLRVASSPADTYADDPRLKYIPADVRAYWSQRITELAPSTPEQIAQQREFLRFRLRMVGEMYAAEVGVIGGTDAPNPYTFPGFGVHDELQLLVEAGLTPMQALRCMTADAARFLGMQESVGTIAPGKAADLVLLDADPLGAVRNTRKIHSVVVRGRMLSRRRLDEMLTAVEVVANPPITAAGMDRSTVACC